jgi:hypothetical protein
MTFAKTSLLTTAALVGAVNLALAAGQSSTHAQALAQAERRVDSLAATTKGGAQQRLLLEKQRIQNLIDDLDAGKPVDPADIDRALQRSQNPGGF